MRQIVLRLLVAMLHTCVAVAQCNITYSPVVLPCRKPRCRWRVMHKNNVTERGLFYHSSTIKSFFDKWDDYQGFLGLETAFFANFLSLIQSSFGVSGGLGEIGVAAGKSFVTLALARRSGEPLFACDLFPALGHPYLEQHGSAQAEVELDNAALANFPMFMDTLMYAGIDPRDVVVHQGPSVQLTDEELFRLGVAPFRIFHVDGGHSAETALHDLRIAACTLANGGVLMVDDVNNAYFPGVQEAFHRFMLLDRPRLRPNLVPFLYAGRLYLTDESHATRYRESLRGKVPEGTFYKHARFMYGSEVLNLGGFPYVEQSIRALVHAEEQFFPWTLHEARQKKKARNLLLNSLGVT